MEGRKLPDSNNDPEAIKKVYDILFNSPLMKPFYKVKVLREAFEQLIGSYKYIKEKDKTVKNTYEF